MITNERMGIYIHVPFCLKKCFYCDFTSFCSTKENIKTYVKHLVKEINLYGKELEEYKSRVKTLYFGGGTPSILDTEDLREIIINLKKYIDFDTLEEVTFEANPESVTLEKFSKLRQLGINRISLGVQSLDNDSLIKLGRIHDSESVINAVRIIRQCGFSNLNLDLIISTPWQTKEILVKDIEGLIGLNPEHISCYSLSVEEGTEFHKMNITPLDDEIDREYFHLLKDLLLEKGYFRYEISNFSKKGFESKHNTLYWNGFEYFGLGLGAHGYLNGKRYENYLDFDEYFKKTDNYLKPVYNSNVIDFDERKKEHIILNLRTTKGLDIIRFNQLFDCDFLNDYKKSIEKLLNHNLCFIKNNHFILTDEGFDISNTVYLEFY
jgi:oxygen-independent coproporphyrinogen-3 oxidase